MARLLSEIGSFIPAFVTQLQGYVTGGTLTAALHIYERYRGQNIPFRIYLLVFVGTYSLIGSFTAWQEQYERAETLARELSQGSQPQPPITVNVPPPVIVEKREQPPAKLDRRLSDAEVQIFASHLVTSKPYCVLVISPAVGHEREREERLRYAQDISRALSKAQWETAINSEYTPARDYEGILVFQYASEEERQLLAGAFSAIAVSPKYNSGSFEGLMTMMTPPNASPRYTALAMEARTCVRIYVGENQR